MLCQDNAGCVEGYSFSSISVKGFIDSLQHAVDIKSLSQKIGDLLNFTLGFFENGVVADEKNLDVISVLDAFFYHFIELDECRPCFGTILIGYSGHFFHGVKYLFDIAL